MNQTKLVLFHDESILSANEYQKIMWGVKGQKKIIKELDFIHQLHAFLALSDEEYEKAKKLNPNMRKYAHDFLVYGKSKEGN